MSHCERSTSLPIWFRSRLNSNSAGRSPPGCPVEFEFGRSVPREAPRCDAPWTSVVVVSSASIYFDNAAAGDACAASIAAPAGRSASLEIPSGEVKLNRPFDVPEAGTTTMLLDFDGDRSIRETGNGRFMMSPVIAVVSVK